MDVSRGRHEAHRGARGEVHRGRPPRSGAGALRPARSLRIGPASGRAAPGHGAPRVPGLARADRVAEGQPGRLEHLAHRLRPVHRPPGAAYRRLRRGPRARAAGAGRSVVHHRLDPRPGGGDVPHLQREPALERDRQRDRGAADAQPPARPDRRLRGGRLDRSALLRRPLPGHPQRRPRRPAAGGAGRAAPAGGQAEDRVRGPGRRAQGAAPAAPGLRGAARAHPDRADRDRPLARRALAADARHARCARAGQGRRRDQAPRARVERCPVRPLPRW